MRDKLTNGEPNSTSCTNFNRGKVFVTADGTSTTFISDTDIFDYLHSNPPDFPPVSGYILLHGGTRFRIDSGKFVWMRDRNGNKLSFNHPPDGLTEVTDSLGHHIQFGGTMVTYKGFGGVPRTIRIQRSGLENALRSGFNLRTERDLFPQLNESRDIVVSPTVTTSITLPNNQQYKFYYNSYAELARVELPTGGAIEYDYAPGLTDGPENGYLKRGLNGHHIYRRVVERRVYPDGGSGGAFAMRTTYSRPESSSSNAGYVQADQYNSTGALLGRQRHYFYGSARDSFGQGPTKYSPWQEGLEYQTEEWDVLRGTALRRVTHTWSQPVAGSHWPLTQPETQASAKPNDPHIADTVTTLCDVTPNLVSKQTFSYDQYNNQTDVYEYDFGSGAPGPLIRRTHTSYLTNNPRQGNVNYATDLNIHIRDLPVQRIVYDASGSPRSRTDFIYDDYGLYPLVDCPDIVQHDSLFHAGYGARGNLTGEILYNPGGSPSEIRLNKQYDIAGNQVKAVDGRGFATDYIYEDRYGSTDDEDESRSNSGAPELAGGLSYAFPTKVTKIVNGLEHTTYTQYDYYIGKPVNWEDSNGFVSSAAYNDPHERLTQSVQERYKVGVGVAAEKRQLTITYDDSNRVVTTTSDLNTFNDNILSKKSYYDGLGRGWRDAAREGSTWTITDLRFDALGRVSHVSNPFRGTDPDSASSPPGPWTTTDYDALGRVTRITAPDNAHVDTVYNGNQTTVTDQAGKSRRSETDALGRLVRVTEDPGNLNYDTYYFYDTLDNLIQVAQGSQNRFFAYDALSRLISATNPENGPMAFGYDQNGNLILKTDARGVKTIITYDVLNRIRSKAYVGLSPEGTTVANATPPVNYFYDDYSALPSGAPRWQDSPSKGRLIGVTYGGGSEGTYYKYDASGAIVTNQQRQGTSNYVTTYFYNRAGSVTREERGSAVRRRILMAYDQANRLSSVQTGSFSGAGIILSNLVSNITYTPFGLLQSETYGNGLIHSRAYNERLQPTEIRLGRPDNLESVFRLNYIYGAAHDVNGQDAEITPIHNNGNVARTKYFISGTLQYSQTFQYDPINRLRYAVEHKNGIYDDASRAWYQSFDYDPKGNRGINVANTSDNADAANHALQLADFSAANNRIARDGFVYDAAGNLTAEPGKGYYTYDAEGRMVRAIVASGATSQYFYDGNGRRIKKIIGTVATIFEYGAGGELITERKESTGEVAKDYLYADGSLLATTTSGAGEYAYAAADNLGSPRVWTDKGGNVVAGGRHDYLPFGEELFAGYGTRTTDQGYAANFQADGQRNQFTGYERDSETNLDFAQARYFASAQGRFTSADPLLASGNPINPQSWNRYSYALNRPVSVTDPSGMLIGLGTDITQKIAERLMKIVPFPPPPRPSDATIRDAINKIKIGNHYYRPTKIMRKVLAKYYRAEYLKEWIKQLEQYLTKNYGPAVAKALTLKGSSTQSSSNTKGFTLGGEGGAGGAKGTASYSNGDTSGTSDTGEAELSLDFRESVVVMADVNAKHLAGGFMETFARGDFYDRGLGSPIGVQEVGKNGIEKKPLNRGIGRGIVEHVRLMAENQAQNTFSDITPRR